MIMMIMEMSTGKAKTPSAAAGTQIAMARKVKSDMYCPIRKEDTSTGPMYESGVLLYVSNDNLKLFEDELFGNIGEEP